ncbi:hypothetical protein [Bacillus sp. OAE603]|uniref:hypothetical protein n=1 Tax=Gottfriedia sp. OAE603 TaxID=2663872 RepID=UPI00178ABA65
MRDVIDQNKRVRNEKISCLQCGLFDSNTNKCGVFQIETSSKVTKCHLYKESTLLDELDCMVDKDEQYPLVPSFTPGIPNLIWYISPEKTFGCWIINQYKKRFFLTSEEVSREKVLTGIYHSITPLHKHQSSDTLQSHLAWLINENGEGRYVLINKYNEIVYIK